MGVSRSGPVWTKQERVHDHSTLLQQFLGDWPPHKYHLISCSFEAEEPFCSLWLPWSLDQRKWSSVHWDFKHRTSSPGNSKANSKVESAVKTAKNLLRKALSAGTDPYIAILDYRNTPTQGMASSPAQRLMSRRTRTLLPTTKTRSSPTQSPTEWERYPTTE